MGHRFVQNRADDPAMNDPLEALPPGVGRPMCQGDIAIRLKLLMQSTWVFLPTHDASRIQGRGRACVLQQWISRNFGVAFCDEDYRLCEELIPHCHSTLVRHEITCHSFSVTGFVSQQKRCLPLNTNTAN